jgi:hypothetical protein
MDAKTGAPRLFVMQNPISYFPLCARRRRIIIMIYLDSSFGRINSREPNFLINASRREQKSLED